MSITTGFCPVAVMFKDAAKILFSRQKQAYFVTPPRLRPPIVRILYSLLPAGVGLFICVAFIAFLLLPSWFLPGFTLVSADRNSLCNTARFPPLCLPDG